MELTTFRNNTNVHCYQEPMLGLIMGYGGGLLVISIEDYAEVVHKIWFIEHQWQSLLGKNIIYHQHMIFALTVRDSDLMTQYTEHALLQK